MIPSYVKLATGSVLTATHGIAKILETDESSLDGMGVGEKLEEKVTSNRAINNE